MNITITGNLGSGKSSVCRELEKSGFTIISAGDIFRQIAEEKGMTVLELNEAAKKDRSIDDMIDNRSTQLGKEMDHTVFDSRLAWRFVEDSFKVFLLVDTQEAARRVFEGVSRNAESYRNIEEARAGLEERAMLEKERFHKLYGLDYYDVCNYDLVIESTYATPEQIAQEIQRNFELYQAQMFSTKVEFNLKCLFPSVKYEKMDADQFAYELEKAKQDQTICADDSLCLIEKNGHYYLSKDHPRVFAAIAAGKIFAEIKDIQRDEQAQNTVQQLSEEDIACYEQAGQFQYQSSPLKRSKKTGYTADFSKLFCKKD